MIVIVILFMVVLFLNSILIYPAVRGVRELYVGVKDPFTAKLLLAVGMGFSGILYHSIFWFIVFSLRFVLSDEIRQSTGYGVFLLVSASIGFLVPTIIINNWWNEFRKKVLESGEVKNG